MVATQPGTPTKTVGAHAVTCKPPSGAVVDVFGSVVGFRAHAVTYVAAMDRQPPPSPPAAPSGGTAKQGLVAWPAGRVTGLAPSATAVGVTGGWCGRSLVTEAYPAQVFHDMKSSAAAVGHQGLGLGCAPVRGGLLRWFASRAKTEAHSRLPSVLRVGLMFSAGPRLVPPAGPREALFLPLSFGGGVS